MIYQKYGSLIKLKKICDAGSIGKLDDYAKFFIVYSLWKQKPNKEHVTRCDPPVFVFAFWH